jgi:hypothetical protein
MSLWQKRHFSVYFQQPKAQIFKSCAASSAATFGFIALASSLNVAVSTLLQWHINRDKLSKLLVPNCLCACSSILFDVHLLLLIGLAFVTIFVTCFSPQFLTPEVITHQGT